MTNDHVRPGRTWQEIAFEASKETRPQRRAQLTQELERVLDERRKAVRKIQNLPAKQEKTG